MSTQAFPWRAAAGVAASYSVFAALVSFWFTGLTGVSYWSLQPDSSTGFGYILLMNLAVWGSWAAFAPAVFWLGRTQPIDRAHWRQALAFHAVGALAVTCSHIVLVATARFLLQNAWGVPAVWTLSVRDAFFRTLDFELPVYWALLGVQHARHYYAQIQEREVRAAQLEMRLVEAQLQSLQRQLHPHFLFNTLHAIAALVHRDADRAETMIERLSDLLRISLADVGSQEVPLAAELEHLRAYLDIEQVHFGDRLVIEYDVDPKVLSALVPPLLLQPLAENAIRHGLEPRAGRGTLTIHASRRAGQLSLAIVDDGCGWQEDAGRVGIGLSNTRARLAKRYQRDAALTLSANAGGGLTAAIVLPFSEEEADEDSDGGGRRPAARPRAAAGAAC